MTDPYLDPDTGVLLNKLGATDPDTLTETEYALTALRLRQAAKAPIAGALDLAHVPAIHGFIFQGVYAWAGTVRTVPLPRPGALFALPQYVEVTGGRTASS